MSLYSKFKTNTDLERKGVELDYGDCVITVARAGGANRAFSRALEAKTRPYRRAIQTETMDPKVADRLLMETYAETVILKWETNVAGEGDDRRLEPGIENPVADDLLPVNKDNILKTLQALPELWQDIQQQASKFALFRETMLEDDAGN